MYIFFAILLCTNYLYYQLTEGKKRRTKIVGISVDFFGISTKNIYVIKAMVYVYFRQNPTQPSSPEDYPRSKWSYSCNQEWCYLQSRCSSKLVILILLIVIHINIIVCKVIDLVIKVHRSIENFEQILYYIFRVVTSF